MEQERNDNYDHVLKYTSVFGGVQGLVILIGLVRNKFMALLLGAGGMGFNALLTSAQILPRSVPIWESPLAPFPVCPPILKRTASSCSTIIFRLFACGV